MTQHRKHARSDLTLYVSTVVRPRISTRSYRGGCWTSCFSTDKVGRRAHALLAEGQVYPAGRAGYSVIGQVSARCYVGTRMIIVESVAPTFGRDFMKPDRMAFPVQHSKHPRVGLACTFAEACPLRSLISIRVTLVT